MAEPVAVPAAAIARLGATRPTLSPRLRTALQRRTPLVLLLVVLVAETLVILHDTRTYGFWADDWSWIDRRLGWNIQGFLQPFNLQMQALLTLAYKVMFVTVGLTPTWPYRLLLLFGNAACVLLTWRVASRPLGPWLALIPAGLLIGLGFSSWEDITMQIQINYLGSAASALAAMLLIDRRTKVADVLAALLLCTAWMWCSVGLPFVIGVLVELAWSRDTRRRTWIAIAPLVLYLIWYEAYGASVATISHIVAVPSYFYEASAYTFAAIFGFVATTGFTPDVGAGPGQVIFAACVVVIVLRLLRHGAAGLPPRAAGAIAGYIVFWIVIPLNRGGTPAARYLYPAGIFVFVAAAAMLSWRRLPRLAYPLMAAGMAWVWIAGYNVLLEATTHFGHFDVLVNADVGAIQVAGPAMDLSNTLRLQLNTRFTSEAFSAAQYERAMRQLHSAAGFSVSRLLAQPELVRRRVDADLLLFERIAPSPQTGAQPAGPGLTVEAAGGGTASTTQACTTFVPRSPTINALDVTVPAGAAVLVPGHPGPVAFTARRFSLGFPRATPAAAVVSPAPAPAPAPAAGVVALQAPTTVLAASTAPEVIPFRADTSTLPWHLRVSSTKSVTMCTVPSSPTPQTDAVARAAAARLAAGAPPVSVLPTSGTATPKGTVAPAAHHPGGSAAGRKRPSVSRRRPAH